MATGAVSANRLEILQIANAVAAEKNIDKRIVLEAMAEAIQKANEIISTSKKPLSWHPGKFRTQYKREEKSNG